MHQECARAQFRQGFCLLPHRLGSVRGERFRDKRRSVRREQGQEKSAIEREPLQIYQQTPACRSVGHDLPEMLAPLSKAALYLFDTGHFSPRPDLTQGHGNFGKDGKRLASGMLVMDTNSYDGLHMFTAFIAIKSARLATLLCSTSFFGQNYPAFLSQWTLSICDTPHSVILVNVYVA